MSSRDEDKYSTCLYQQYLNLSLFILDPCRPSEGYRTTGHDCNIQYGQQRRSSSIGQIFRKNIYSSGILEHLWFYQRYS